MRTVCLSAFLSAAALSDLHKRKISNSLLLAGVFFAILTALQTGEFRVLMDGILSSLVIFLIFWSFYCFRLIGAGDVKLFMVTALYTGGGVLKRSLLPFLVFSVLVTGVLALKKRSVRNLEIPMAVPAALGVLWSFSAAGF